MIRFDDWKLTVPEAMAPRQYDHLVHTLEVSGPIPPGWTWEALLSCGGNLDILTLTETETGLAAPLTGQALALSGYYAVQLRAVSGERVRHTNVVQLFVGPSLSGDARWPEVPTAFSQAEARIRSLNAHPPVPGTEGYWLVWDPEAEAYAASALPLPVGGVGDYAVLANKPRINGVELRGDVSSRDLGIRDGEQGPQGEKGDLTVFTDGASVSDWAAEAVAWAVGEGILTGKSGNTLDPQGTATRAEVATILMRFCQKDK